MSGGEWGYQSFALEEMGQHALTFFTALAQTEQICDWAVSGDTSPEAAGAKLYDLWVKTFNKVYGS